MTLLVALAVLAGTSLVAPVAARVWGRSAGYPLALGYVAAGALVGMHVPRVIDGDPVTFSVPWVPGTGVGFSLVLDGLSMLFALLVCGIGALVMAYSACYYKPDKSTGRDYLLLTAFATAMLGLVLASDLILLFVFWELTSVTSFFLIGGEGRAGSQKGAMRALLVTGLGGLVLFAGLVLLGVAAGTFNLGDILAHAASVEAHPASGAILALVLVGAFTKSAQFPFQFWLPGAMVAPTPVSTYLHAATMVKAGIYLLARLSPIWGDGAAWLYAVTFTGLVTAVIGAALALKQYDLKALLAYSTVSQLGFIVALLGIGTFPAMAAAILHTMAHAAYKATLFMVVGIIDVEAGSRDIRKLKGLRHAMAATAVVTALAALSMAGFPPFVGFVSKEEAFSAFLDAPGPEWLGPLAGGLALSATIMTFGYGIRLFEGAFGGRPVQKELYDPSRSFLAPAAITTVAGLVLGVLAPALDAFVGQVAESAFARAGEVHLQLWHGFTPALGLSGLTITGGLVIFAFRRPIDRITDRMRLPLAGYRAFDFVHDRIVAFGRPAARPFVSVAPARMLAWVLAAAAAAAGAAWLVYGERLPGPAPEARSGDWVIAGILVVAVIAAGLARTRLAAVAVVGIIGFAIALLYVGLGAPDLALTQLLVETLTVMLVVLVFRRLPQRFSGVRLARRVGAGVAAIAVGAGVFGVTHALTGRRGLSDAARYYLEAAPEEAGGENVVNTILVDFRALDTLGEITVLAVAAIGVFALVRIRRSKAR